MEVPLKHGKILLFDDRDWAAATLISWYAVEQRGRWYVLAHDPGKPSGAAKLRFHRFVLDAKPGQGVDHVNGEGLDNRRANLRLCGDALNQQNTGPRGGGSQYKCVAWSAAKRKWQVALRFGGRGHFVGYFDGEEAAARAYDAAILPLAGEYARPNFPVRNRYVTH